jgi:hypothetical protein
VISTYEKQNGTPSAVARDGKTRLSADLPDGIEVVGLHQAGHVLVLFVRHIGHRGVKLGERRHYAVTAAADW